MKRDQRMEEFRKSFKNIEDVFLSQEVKVPEIIYLANKSENNYEGDVLADFYKVRREIVII